MEIARETLLALYRNMRLLRRFEESVSQAYFEGRTPAMAHLYIGEEAVASGVCAHLQSSDYVTSTHRSHAHALSKGVAPRRVMAELFARSTGCSGGRGGSMHLYSAEDNYLGSSGIVGGNLPIGTGAAFSAKYRGTNQVVVTFFGDGAGNTGAFHESLNLAGIWQLPIIYVCENNLYATQMSFMKATAGQNVAIRAQGYAMPGVQVDGQDVVAVYEAAGEAVARARAGGGPTLIECKTYRFGGHAIGDPGDTYRPPEEVAAWKARDPLALFIKQLLDSGQATQAALDGVAAEIEAVIKDALDYAESSPLPVPEDATSKVFSTVA